MVLHEQTEGLDASFHIVAVLVDHADGVLALELGLDIALPMVAQFVEDLWRQAEQCGPGVDDGRDGLIVLVDEP